MRKPENTIILYQDENGITHGTGGRIINASKLGNIEIPDYDTEKCLQDKGTVLCATKRSV